MKRATEPRFLLVELLVASLLMILPFKLAGAGKPRGRGSIDSDRRTPILIELFTSEGCSSCPPADALLERLDRSQPISGADLIVLSEHVDYWNDGGWKDPYSSHVYSERQKAYAAHLGLTEVYTPQMVVDGSEEFVGSNEQQAVHAIAASLKLQKISVNLSAIHREGSDTVGLHVHAEPLPPGVDANAADVLIAVADESDESSVGGGENGGRTLRHVAVLRSVTRIGTLGKSAKYSQDARIRIAGFGDQPLRLVAIVQDPKTGRVWGAGSGRFVHFRQE